ncbi:MAG: glycerophosphodiester phosphodiesterase, partial [Desulfobacteraceae bacterium]|nr:glycerophosphodiester phosphodiesterase [Desulfobacteraceae bacterium]
ENFSLPDAVIRIINRVEIPLEHIIISSFNHSWLFQTEYKEPKLEVQALLGEALDEKLDFGDFSFSTYNISHPLIQDHHIQELKKRGKRLNLFTVNDEREIIKYVNAGVDGFFTDFPQQFCPQYCK